MESRLRRCVYSDAYLALSAKKNSMNARILLLFAGVLASACAAPHSTPAPSTNAKEILILSPQGVDPAIDPAFNELVQRVTQPFSHHLTAALTREGQHTVTVLDQDPKHGIRGALAIHSAKARIDRAVVLTIERGVIDKEEKLNLRATFVVHMIIMVKGNPEPAGVTAPWTIAERIYVVSDLNKGDDTRTLEEQATDFANVMKTTGFR
jgi:hypothetical protein